MGLRNNEKKAIEMRVLTAARGAGIQIPSGEIHADGPDFIFESGKLGIEISELMPLASSNSGIAPATEDAYHQEVVHMAQQIYEDCEIRPAKIVLYFGNARGRKRDKKEMARILAEFVKGNVGKANPVANFDALQLPDSFGSMSIANEKGNWWCSGCWGSTAPDIRSALESRIREKDKKIPTYRKNLQPNAEIWLLLYTTAAVPRYVPMPYGVEDWRIPFDFERVFWFDSLMKKFAEIRRG